MIKTMKTYTIEAKVIRYDTLTIEASSKEEAIKIAEQTDGPDWEMGDEEPREIISITV